MKRTDRIAQSEKALEQELLNAQTDCDDGLITSAERTKRIEASYFRHRNNCRYAGKHLTDKEIEYGKI